MSFLGGRDKKSHFYVEFLGWMECRGLRGHKYTDPVIRELRRKHKRMTKPPKLTIQVSKKYIGISQDEVDKKGRNIRKKKLPSIPARDVTFVHQATRSKDGRPDDIVACIYLGYMPRTQRFVHVHVYRFDEATTAVTFARQMASIVEANKDHIRLIELDLANHGEIEDPRLTSSDEMSEPLTTDSAMGSASSAYSDEDSPTFGSDDIDPDLQSLHEVTPFDNVADELKIRLQMGSDKPLLLPPKDYDTISRAHGNLEHINKRRCLNLNIVGETATKDGLRARNESSESGIDLASPQSDVADGIDTGSSSSPQQRHSGFLGQPQPFPDFTDGLTGNELSNQNSRSGSPVNLIYPPKHKSPPLSPQIGNGGMYHGGNSRAPYLSRQGSHNSHHSSQNSDPDALYYRSGPNSEIYTLPVKKKPAPLQNGYSHGSAKTSPREDVPPADYLDDDDVDEDAVQMRGSDGASSYQPHLTRSMPAELIRSEMSMNGGRFSPRHSAELRQMARLDPQIFVGPHQIHSPKTRRVNSSRR